MTITEMHTLFDLVTDKAGIPYFSEAEIDAFLNFAQRKVLEEYIPNRDEPVSIENTQPIFTAIGSLVYPVVNLNTTSGKLADSTINTALQALSGDSEDYYYILSVSYDGLPAKYVRHNDRYRFQQNDFKTASAASPQFLADYSGLEFLPVDDTADIDLMVVKTPVEVSKSGAIDSELPERLHNRVIAMALVLADISAREEGALTLMEQVTR